MTRSPRFSRTLSAHELARFLAQLAATGNFALACLQLGRSKSGLYKRRARDPFFAAECEAALAVFRLSHRAQAHGCAATEGCVEEMSIAGMPGAYREAQSKAGFPPIHPRTPLKTTWNMLTLGTHAGRPQIRRSVSGCLTIAGLTAFLKTLAATANIRFAAQSVGVAPSSIYARRRRDPHFAKAMEDATQTALAALEMRVIEASGVFAEDFHDDGEEGQGAIERFTASEALQFLALHSRARSPSHKRGIAPQPEAYPDAEALNPAGQQDEHWSERDARLFSSAEPGPAKERGGPRIRRL